MEGRLARFCIRPLIISAFYWTQVPAAHAQTTHTEFLTQGHCLCANNEPQPLVQQKVQHFRSDLLGMVERPTERSPERRTLSNSNH